ncbi:MAG: NAD(P)-dependent glycerol-3-phosphate dehydrogenase [Puniceicoccales bacterium]|jgi:glycerol-3-phosphate dehydrogenase (NAD(P)+)|nr:NAD(P)-dependent glycerol-3-phosphate dehydrogenase [Puniceicoccales bacterium]
MVNESGCNRVAEEWKSNDFAANMKISVFGAGAWGTAVACYCSGIGHDVTLLPRFNEQAESMRKHRENIDFLPGVKLPASMSIVTAVDRGMDGADVAFLACPSIGIEDLCGNIGKAKKSENLPLLISLCQGIQNENMETASNIIERMLPAFEYGVLAGPTNAKEVADGKNAAMVLATKSARIYGIQERLSSEKLRIYSSDDVRGVELGGCLKNIYAIGAGICDGLRLGDNAKAAYLTRSLKELVTIGVSLGGKAETFYGLSGFGDFIATCMGAWSRNRTFGERIGMGELADDILATQKTAVEGYKTTKALHGICEKNGINAPVIAEIYAILYMKKSVKDSVSALLNRSLKPEL